MGTTQDYCQQRLYKQWSDFCATVKINPDLQDPSVPRVEVLQVYRQRSDTPSTPSAKWTKLGRSRFLRHGGRLGRPISWLVSQTPGIPPTPRSTTDWTCGSPGSLKPTGLGTLRSDRKKLPPSASSTPSCPLPTQPLTRRPDTPPTWSSWDYTSAYGHAST